MAGSKYAGTPNGWNIEVISTSIGGGNSTFTPKNPDIDAASTIVFNGQAGFVVGKDYVIRVDSK